MSKGRYHFARLRKEAELGGGGGGDTIFWPFMEKKEERKAGKGAKKICTEQEG